MSNQSIKPFNSVGLQRSDSNPSQWLRPRRLDLKSLLLFTIVFASASALYYFNLGSHPLFNPDEALYSEPAREMLESGDFLTTHLNYVVRYTKPPLTIWSQAAAFSMFGVNEFAARFFSAASGAILVGITYLFAEKYLGRRCAFLGAAFLATAPMYLGISRMSITDIPLSLLVVGATFALFHAYHMKETRWKYIAYVLLGLAVMTKGPVALVLCGGVLGLYHLTSSSIKKAWSFYSPFIGLSIVALIALPWFALEIYITNGEYFQSFLMRENFQRFTGVVDHKYGWWYHPAAMLGGFFPWTIFLVGLLLAALQNFFSPRSSAVSTSLLAMAKAWRDKLQNLDKREHALLLCACSVLFILVFFSMSVSKLLPYTLPAFPALAILTAGLLDRCIERNEKSAVVFSFTLMTICSLAGFIAPPLLAQKLRDCPPELVTLIPVATSALALVSGICLFTSLRSIYRALIYFSISLITIICLFGPKALDTIASEWERPFVSLVEQAAASGDTIVIHAMRKPSATFYAGRQVLKPESPQGLMTELTKIPSAYIVTKTKESEFLESQDGIELISTRGKYLLARWKHPSPPNPPYEPLNFTSGEPDR